MSEFTNEQLYIISKILFYSLSSILIFIFVSYIIYLLCLSIRNKSVKDIEEKLENNILNAIYGTTTVDKNKIEQTLNRLYSEKQYNQQLYITSFNYSITAVNIFLGIIAAIYSKYSFLKEHFFSITLIASAILYFIYAYMDNISVRISNQSIAIKYLENKLCMNIQSFSFNGYYKSLPNILVNSFILQYIVMIFACAWIIAGALISLNKDNIYSTLFLSIIAVLIFPLINILEKYKKTKIK